MTGRLRQQIGTVLSDLNDQSITVGVSWSQKHRIYGKARRRVTRFVAHDPDNRASVGDRVLIEQSRPVSRTKKWRLVTIVEKIDVAEIQPEDIDPEGN